MGRSKKQPKKEVAQEKRDLVKTIRGIWDSLDSHLEPAIEDDSESCESCGSKRFHKKCCIEYAEMLIALAKLL